MSYGFRCGSCSEALDTPFEGAENAARFAQGMGWRTAFGATDAWGGNAYNVCPYCANKSSDPLHVGLHEAAASGLFADAVAAD